MAENPIKKPMNIPPGMEFAGWSVFIEFVQAKLFKRFMDNIKLRFPSLMAFIVTRSYPSRTVEFFFDKEQDPTEFVGTFPEDQVKTNVLPNFSHIKKDEDVV